MWMPEGCPKISALVSIFMEAYVLPCIILREFFFFMETWTGTGNAELKSFILYYLTQHKVIL